MGLADEGEVAPWFHLTESDPALPGAYWPADNLTVTATRVDVGLDHEPDDAVGVLVGAVDVDGAVLEAAHRDRVGDVVLLQFGVDPRGDVAAWPWPLG